MRSICVVCILSITIVLSCNDASKRASCNITVSFGLDSIDILPSLENKLYQVSTVRDSSFFAYYSPKRNSICVINLDNKRIKKILNVTHLGKRLRSFKFINDDSIFLLFNDQLKLVNIKGDVLSETRFNEYRPENSFNMIIDDYFGYMPLYYNQAKGEIYVNQHPFNINFWNIDFFKAPVECAINVKTGAITDLNLYYPEIYKKKNYGNAFYYYREYDDGNLIYSFQASPDIMVYNLEKHSTSTTGTKSELHKDIMPFDTLYKEDLNMVADHLIGNPLYLKIMYDTYKKLYYRFYYDGAEPGKNGRFRTFADKKLYLIVYDSSFRTVKHIKLDKEQIWSFSFITPNGLYIQNEPKSENEKNIYFKVYNFSYIN